MRRSVSPVPISSDQSLRNKIASKLEVEKQQEEENCTFHPTLIHRGRDPVVKPVAGSRFDHLYGDAVKRKSGGIKAVGNTDEKELTFKPSISPKARSLSRDRKPSDVTNSMYSAVGAGRVITKEVEKELFQPVINRRARSTDRMIGMDVGTRLYASRDTHKENLEKKKEEAAMRASIECTFNPAVSTKSRYSSVSSDTKTLGTAAVEKQILYAEKKKIKLEEQKKIQLAREMAEAKFQPSLSTRSGSTSPILRAVAGIRFDNLYSDAMKRKTEDPIVKAKLDLSEHTFKPSISPKARSTSVTRSSSELVKSMHTAVGSGNAVSHPVSVDTNPYKPEISKRAKSIDRSAVRDIADHLYAFKNSQQERLEELKVEEAIRALEGCTFTPEISSRSRLTGDPDESVVDRLLEYGVETKRRLKAEKILRAECDMVGVTFQPKIPKHMLPEHNEETFDRLYHDAIKRKSDDPLVRANVDESHMTFHPKIPDLPSYIDSTKPVEKKDEMFKRLYGSNFAHKPLVHKHTVTIDPSDLGAVEKNEERLRRELARENSLSPKESPRGKISSTSPKPSPRLTSASLDSTDLSNKARNAVNSLRTPLAAGTSRADTSCSPKRAVATTNGTRVSLSTGISRDTSCSPKRSTIYTNATRASLTAGTSRAVATTDVTTTSLSAGTSPACSPKRTAINTTATTKTKPVITPLVDEISIGRSV